MSDTSLASASAPAPVPVPTYQQYLDLINSTKRPAVDQLKALGYGDDKINPWVIQQRTQMTAAGVPNDQIEKFLFGVSAPTEPPVNWIARFNDTPLGKALTTAPSGSPFASGFTKTYEGVGNIDPKSEQFMRDSGLWNPNQPTLSNPGSPLRTFNEAAMRPAWTALDGLFRLPSAIINGIGSEIGQDTADFQNTVAALQGKGADAAVSPEEAEQRQEYFAGAAQVAAAGALATSGEPGVSLRGTNDVAVGGMPKTDDFINSGSVIAGKPDPAVSSKLVTVYQDTGLHPAEVAADAQVDATVRQDLLSTNVRTPQVYLPPPKTIDPAAVDELGKAVNSISDEFVKAELQAGVEMIKDNPKGAGTAISIIDRYAQGLPSAEQQPIEDALHKLLASFDETTGEGAGGGTPPPPPPSGTAGTEGEPEPKKIEGPLTAEQAMQNIMAKLTPGQKEGLGKTPTPGEFYTWFVNKLFPITKFPDAYEAFRLLAGAGGKADHFLHIGSFDYSTLGVNGESLFNILKDFKGAYSGLNLNDFRGFATASHGLNVLWNGFQDQLGEVAKHLPDEVVGEDGRVLHPRAAYQTLVDKLRNTQAGTPERANIVNQFNTITNELIKKKPSVAAKLNSIAQKYDPGIDIPSAMKVVNDYKQYQPYLDRVVQYEHRLIDYMQQSGIIGKEVADQFKERYQAFVPLMRAFGDDYFQGTLRGNPEFVKNPTEFFKTTSGQAVDWVESLIKMTHVILHEADKNEAVRKLVQAVDALRSDAEKFGHDVPISTPTANLPVPFKNEMSTWLGHNGGPALEDDPIVSTFGEFLKKKEPGNITYFQDGQKFTRTIDKELWTAVHSLDPQITDWFQKIIDRSMTFYRGTYILNPDFWLRHVPRDISYSTALYPGKGIFTPIDYARGMAAMLFRTKEFEEWLRAGGGHVSFVALDRKYIQRDLARLQSSTGLGKFTYNSLDKVFSVLQYFTDAALSAGHAGGYIKYKNQLKREGKWFAPTGDTQRNAVQDAAWAGRQTGIDTAVIGSKMGTVNRLVAFLNPTIQDTSQWISRLINPKTAIKTFIGIMLGVTLPKVANWYFNKDNPNYKNLSDYDKDTKYNFFTDNYTFHMEVPFSLGVLFGSGPERLLDDWYNHRPLSDGWDAFGKDLLSSLGVNFIPQVAVPIVEQTANTHLYNGVPLVPNRFTNSGILPEYQYTPATTQLSRQVAMFMSQIPGMLQLQTQPSPLKGVADAVTSPTLIENYLSGWLGGAGTALLSATDLALRKAGKLPDPVKPSGDNLVDNPFIRGFITRHPNDQLGIVSQFYNDYNAVSSIHNTVAEQVKAGNIDVIAHLGGMPAVTQYEFKYSILNSLKTGITRSNQTIQNITDAPGMTAQQKQQAIDGLYAQMIGVATEGLKLAHELNVKLPSK